MRKLILLTAILLYSIGSVKAQSFPEKPTSWVNDYAKILSPQEFEALNSKLGYYEDSTSTQIFVVTMNEHDEAPISMTASEIGQKWGVGQKGKENGMLILIFPNDRQIWIATGYGLEEFIPDAINKRIIENEIKPAFRNGNYYEGLDNATTVIMKLLSGQFAGNPYKKSQPDGNVFGGILFLFVIFIAIFSSIRGGGKGGRSLGRNLPFWMAMGMLSSTRHTHTGSFGGFSSGGGGFGGFSGGGGGSFGGGGAGGSW